MHLQVLATADLDDAALGSVRALLRSAFDGDFADDDWDHACGGWHIVADVAGRTVAHAAVVARILEVDGALLQIGRAHV